MRKNAPTYLYPLLYSHEDVARLSAQPVSALQATCRKLNIDDTSSIARYLAIRITKKANVLIPGDTYSMELIRSLGYATSEQLQDDYMSYLKDIYLPRLETNVRTFTFLVANVESWTKKAAVTRVQAFQRALKAIREATWNTFVSKFEALRKTIVPLIEVVRSSDQSLELRPPANLVISSKQQLSLYFETHTYHETNRFPWATSTPLRPERDSQSVTADDLFPGLRLVSIASQVEISTPTPWWWVVVRPLHLHHEKKNTKPVTISLTSPSEDLSGVRALEVALSRLKEDWKKKM